MYEISQKGLAALKTFEGYKKSAYKDSAQLLTIGVGHLLTKDELSSGFLKATGLTWKNGISDKEVLQVLEADVRRFVAGVNKQLPNIRLFQHEFDALVSFAFNLGLGAFQGSTMRQLILEKSYVAVANEFPKWVRAGGKVVQGLVNRRNAEVRMWRDAEYPA